MRRGQPRRISFQGRSRRARRRPLMRFQALVAQVEGLAADARLDSRGPGLTAITPAACRAIRRRTRTPPPPPSRCRDHSAFHAAGDGHDLAGDVARRGQVRPGRRPGQPRPPGCATLRRAIVRETRRTCSSDDVAARHRRLSPAGSDGVHARERASCARLRSSGSAAARRGSPTWPRA